MKYLSINEAELSKSDNSLAHKYAKKGTVAFAKSSLQEPHIKKGIEICAKWFGVYDTVIETRIATRVLETKKQLEYSQKLFAQIADNQVESELFQIFWDYQIPVPGAFQIKSHRGVYKRFFMMMVNSLRMRFGLDKDRGYMKPKTLKAPGIFHYSRINGDADYNENQQVSTAYSLGSTGSYYFDIDFSQALLNFGKLKEIKPFGKVFKNRGGVIPDEFGYLETVIFHEFMHYYHDDTEYYNIKPGCVHKIMNWASDFRSNYLLSKSGFTQLPLGLYSDEINFDRQMNLDEMYEVVKMELEKQEMQIGSIVVHPDNSLGQIVSINGDSIETRPVSKEEADVIIENDKQERMKKYFLSQVEDPLLVHAYYNNKPFNTSSNQPNQLPPEIEKAIKRKHGERT